MRHSGKNPSFLAGLVLGLAGLCCFCVWLVGPWPFAGLAEAADGPKPGASSKSTAPITLQPGDRVVVLGGTFAERMQHFGFFEVALQRHFSGERITLRHMGWSGDEVGLMPRPLDFGTLEEHLADKKADVILLCFGANEAFKGDAGLDGFAEAYGALIDRLEAQPFHGEAKARLVLVSPIAQEKLDPPFPDPAAHNADLKRYTERIRELAAARDLPFVDLFTPSLALMEHRPAGDDFYTINGVHLNERGYRAVSEMLAAEGFGITQPVTKADEPLRELILKKNRKFFLRWRPINAEYVFGRRKEPFGVISFPPEMRELDSIIAGLEEEIWVEAGK